MYTPANVAALCLNGKAAVSFGNGWETCSIAAQQCFVILSAGEDVGDFDHVIFDDVYHDASLKNRHAQVGAEVRSCHTAKWRIANTFATVVQALYATLGATRFRLASRP